MESLAFHLGIAEVRAFYRAFGGEAADRFSAVKGRWPEVKAMPSLVNGLLLGGMTTAASMISFVNAFVAGVGIALLAVKMGGWAMPASIAAGAACGVLLVVAFHQYQLMRVRAMNALAVGRDVRDP